MTEFEFLTPLDERFASVSPLSLGAGMLKNISGKAFPDLKGIKVAIFGVLEDRLNANRNGEVFSFDEIRRNLYDLYPGNWTLPMADLGDIYPGDSVEDTYFAVQTVVRELIKENVIPVILGGSQDTEYAQYRAYDQLDQMVNLVNIDAQFDLGDAEKPISNKSYLGKIIVDQPYNLFNYSNLGYQTYFNPQEEIELMERLYFDAYRLGDLTSDISIVEPVMRDADMVGLDVGSIGAGALGNYRLSSPNGFDGKEICALARYAGISDRVSSFGIYEINSELNFPSCTMLIAEIIWYFMEGANYRKNENTIFAKKEFIKYQVPIDDEVLIFYKSPLSGRWWIAIPFISAVNNKLKRPTLLPCTQKDYIDACNQIIPERWYKTKRKNEI